MSHMQQTDDTSEKMRYYERNSVQIRLFFLSMILVHPDNSITITVQIIPPLLVSMWMCNVINVKAVLCSWFLPRYNFLFSPFRVDCTCTLACNLHSRAIYEVKNIVERYEAKLVIATEKNKTAINYRFDRRASFVKCVLMYTRENFISICTPFYT